jgi:hypothetical protein
MFGWFRRPPPAPHPLLERLETVERGLRSLNTDWLEFEEKVQRKLWRAAKTRAIDSPPDEPAEEAPRREEDDPRLRGLDPVSARIVRLRRARLVREG